MVPEKAAQEQLAEIELFIEYGVVADSREDAVQLARRYQNNPVALAVLHEFYRTLPEAREEPVTRIQYVDSQQGVTLLLLTTPGYTYLTIVSDDSARILGEFGREEIPDEVLTFFGHLNQQSFYESYAETAELVDLATGAEAAGCPACRVSVGQMHVFGCPVEVCPWCKGQLSRCGCRFEKLELEELTSDQQLDDLLEMLEEKGRIPYREEQKPAYPGTSKGLDR